MFAIFARILPWLDEDLPCNRHTDRTFFRCVTGAHTAFRGTVIGFLAIVAARSPCAEDGALEEIRDADLLLLLNNLSVMHEGHGGKDIIARLYAVRESGECDGTPESCPKMTVYVALSEFGELPEQRLFLLPSSHDWRFIGWDDAPMASGGGETFGFTIERDVPGEDPAAGWWRTERYKVRVSLKSATMTRLPE
jgi:hypothetical protein